MGRKVYIETFDNGPGGWYGWASNAEGAKRLEIENSSVISRGPWWIDYNHAPPGGGYLHLLFALNTAVKRNRPSPSEEVASVNRFVLGGFPTDFTHAQASFKLKGNLDPQGAQLLLLLQTRVNDLYVNHVLVGQPLKVTPGWSKQTLRLDPDPQQWRCLGSRHDRRNFYGWGEITETIRDVNRNLILVFYPLEVVPSESIEGDPHLLKAGEDYAVDHSHLPQGKVILGEVRIEFPKG